MKNVILKGTFILTVLNLVTRILGFFYRLVLTDAVGATGVGIYQLCMSITGICMAVCSTSIGTAIARHCASGKKNTASSYLNCGLLLGILLSVIVMSVIYFNPQAIAGLIMLDDSYSRVLKIVAVSIPFATIHGLINNYYYGTQHIAVPAISTLLEQIMRVGSVYIFSVFFVKNGTLSLEFAFYSMLIGELTSCAYTIIALYFNKNYSLTFNNLRRHLKELFVFALPLTTTRLLTHILQSIESVLIPGQLMLYGETGDNAFAILGMLMGMALPFIMLPTIVTNALSILIMPSVSRAASRHDENLIKKTIYNSIQCCICLGIFCTCFFLTFGKNICSALFGEPALIHFIRPLAWLCPFIFLTTMLTSILNGLGMSYTTSFNNITGIVIRLLSVLVAIPTLGISGYMYGILASQMISCVLHYRKLSRQYNLSLLPAVRTLIKTLLCTLAAVLPALMCHRLFYILPPLVNDLISSLTMCAIFTLLVLKDFQTLLHHSQYKSY